MRTQFAWSVLLLVATSAGCELEDPCDPGQFYRSGSCYVCPSDSQASAEGCACSVAGYVFSTSTGLCGPGEGGVVGESDAGAGGDAALGDVQASCSDFCTFSKACVADNDTAGALIANELRQLGIAGEDTSGCVSRCIQVATTASAQSALACFEQRQATAQCAGKNDLAGAMEALTIYNQCCAGAASEGACALICQVLGPSAIGPFLPFCDG